MNVRYPYTLLDQWKPMCTVMKGQRDQKSSFSALTKDCIGSIGRTYMKLFPKPIYNKQIGCTIYPSIFDFPENMRETLIKTCCNFFTCANREGRNVLDSILKLHGRQILNLHLNINHNPEGKATVEKKGFQNPLQFVTGAQDLWRLKLLIELGADVNGISEQIAIISNDFFCYKMSALWYSTFIAGENLHNPSFSKRFFNSALYLRSCGGIMSPQLPNNMNHENTLKEIDKVIYKKPISLLAGHCDATSSISGFPKEIIMCIGMLFLDIFRNDIK